MLRSSIKFSQLIFKKIHFFDVEISVENLFVNNSFVVFSFVFQ